MKSFLAFSTCFLVDQVLNAGKNKLKSMDEVSGLVNLRALILNGELLYVYHCVSLTELSICWIIGFYTDLLFPFCGRQ